MRAPYGFDLIESCQASKSRVGGFFDGLSAAALKDFDSVKIISAQPAGAVLYLETQQPRGVFVLLEGQVKLTISSAEGKSMILRIAKPGEILGLTPTLWGTPYEATAETLHPCQLAFVRREDFLRFIGKHPEVCQSILRQLGSNYERACEQIRTLGLTSSASGKLARLLLDWSEGGVETKQGIRVLVPLTHEEIGEIIGSTRETVTRAISALKKRRLVTPQGSHLVISNRAGLESFAGA